MGATPAAPRETGAVTMGRWASRLPHTHPGNVTRALSSPSRDTTIAFIQICTVQNISHCPLDPFILASSILTYSMSYSPRDPRLAGSNPAEATGFFQDVKILSTSPPGGTLSWGSRVWDFRFVKEPQALKNRPLSKV